MTALLDVPQARLEVADLWLPRSERQTRRGKLFTPIYAGHVNTPGEECQEGLWERILHSLKRPKTAQAEDARALITLMAGMSDAAEVDVLNSIHNKHGSINLYASPHLALCTATINENSTGSTITEANYTGYGRLALSTGLLGTAAAGAIANSATLTFANCTAGSSTITTWATCTAVTTGQVIVFGTTTSTTISTTQTPPTVNTGAYSVTQD